MAIGAFMPRVVLVLLWGLMLLSPASRAAAQGDVFATDDSRPGMMKVCEQRGQKTVCHWERTAGTEGDVFSRDDRARGIDAGAQARLQACQDDCIRDFSEGAFGDPPCANFPLERCVHQCNCDVNPDCGPMPKHREEALRCPETGGETVVDKGGDGGGAKGLVRKECLDAGAKGIYRSTCEQECRDAAAKGLHRSGCDEVLETAADCRQFAAKGIVRTGCEEFLRDCREAAAKGIVRSECKEIVKKKSPCTDPQVTVAQLVQGLDQCLLTRSKLDWYRSPTMTPSEGATAFHPDGTTDIAYDASVLQGMSSYDRAFQLSHAFAAYTMDLEAQLMGTARPAAERAAYIHEISGFLGACLEQQAMFPEQTSWCPDSRVAYETFAASSRSITRTGTSATGKSPSEIYGTAFNNYPLPMPLELRHMPPWNVVQDVQQALAQLQYAPGPADGKYGPRTKAAIEAFERDRGMPVTGVPHDKVVNLLAQEVGFSH